VISEAEVKQQNQDITDLFSKHLRETKTENKELS
jgi:hypothetical protein